MIRRRKGFTLVEVSLFLALTGLMFLGVIVGMQNSISQQRYNDSVQSFAEFLRTAYSKVANVQSTGGGGKTDKAIYGKLIVFGESKTLDGVNNDDGCVYMYDVIGDVGSIGGGDALSMLKGLRADIVLQQGGTAGDPVSWRFAGIAEEYIPRWGAAIQGVASAPANYLEGAVLIVRHATSGTINTYVSMDKWNINESFSKLGQPGGGDSIMFPDGWDKFAPDGADIDFCVNPNGNVESDNRRDVRIISNARNSSGVEVISLDLDEKIDGNQVGNRCRYVL